MSESSYTDAPTTDSWSSSTLFELLAHERRRYTLQYAHQHTGAVGFDELAAQIVHWERENTTAVGHVNHEDHHERVVASLYHMHLPKLADAGVVDHDADRGTVRSRSNARLETVLSTAEDLDLSDNEKDQFYRALTSHHRRRVLYYLLEENNSNVEELATVLCGWEATTTETMQAPADRRDLRIRLSHIHLPRLADAGLIDYESQAGSVQFDSLHPQAADIIRQSVRA